MGAPLRVRGLEGAFSTELRHPLLNSRESLSTTFLAGDRTASDGIAHSHHQIAPECEQLDAARTRFPVPDDVGDQLTEDPADHMLQLTREFDVVHLKSAIRVEPVLVLDDVFSELDETRRERLAGVVTDAEQVLITAAVGADVPDFPSARRFRVRGGVVEPVKELEVADD